jgi:hypothetical protein
MKLPGEPVGYKALNKMWPKFQEGLKNVNADVRINVQGYIVVSVLYADRGEAIAAGEVV